MESKSIEIRSPFRIDQSIYLLGDVHIGSANFARPEFVKSVNMIKESGGYWIGMGDYVDCITTRDPRFNPFEIAKEFGVRDMANLPMAQANEFMKLIEPIKDKCLGLISGNHEDKYRQHNGTDITDYICQTIGATNLRQKAWINLRILDEASGKQRATVTMCLAHGAGGGGMREGYPTNKAYDTFRWDIADIHAMGHLHRMACDRAIHNEYLYDVLKQRPSWYIVNGCYMHKATIGSEGYFENRAGKESDIGMVKISLSGNTDQKSNIIIEASRIYM